MVKKSLKPSEMLNAKSNALSEITRTEIIMCLSSCDKCPIRKICDKKETMSVEERRKGCDDIRSLYLNYVKAYSKPEALMIKRMSEIGTKLAMQTVKDASEDNVSSKEYIELAKLEQNFLDMLLKYGKGTHSVQEIIVRKEFREDMEVDPKVYENIQEGVVVEKSESK